MDRADYITLNITVKSSSLALTLRLRTRHPNGILVAVNDLKEGLNVAIVNGYLKVAVGRQGNKKGDIGVKSSVRPLYLKWPLLKIVTTKSSGT